MEFSIRPYKPEDCEAVHHIFSGEQVIWGTMRLPFDSFDNTRRRMEIDDGRVRLVAAAEDEVVGWIAEGQLAKITGANEPTGWWRVMCPDDTVGSCWVPSDTQITTPTQPPASAQAEVSSLP